MTQREALNDDQKKLNWLLGLEKETLAHMAHQQSKIIEKLQKAAKVQAVPQWIPVSERLPDEGTYFCLGHNGTPFVCLFRTTKYEGKIWLRSTGTRRIDGITHWMPLPAPPTLKDGEL